MIILKVGGGKNINWDFIASDLKTLKDQVVIVHGANAWMKDVSEKIGIVEKIITSPSGHTSRYTDDEVMGILTMVYSGLINKKIVACLQKHGVNAIGLTGADGRIWLGKRKDAILSFVDGRTKIIRDCLTGNVISINTKLLLQLVKDGYVPVVTIPAITTRGELINVDNDRAVAVMVKELKVKKIIMLFEASGLLVDKNDEESRIGKIRFGSLDFYMEKMEGRMRKKLLGVKEAFKNGVELVYFGDGRVITPLQKVLEGKGTTLSK